MERTSAPFSPIDFKMHFPALDGLRALAVTMIFALHYGGGIHSGAVLEFVNAVRLRGWMGVDLFFVLSGFLITGILYDTRLDSHYFKRFFARRCLRIFPVFYLTFAVIALLTPVFVYQWRLGHLWFLVYLGNIALGFDPALRQIASLNHPTASAHIEHFWSLCAEEQFYLLWTIMVWRVRDRIRLIRIAATLSLLALALRTLFVMGMLPGPVRHFDASAMTRLLPFRVDALLAGALLALLLRGPAADAWQRRCRWLFGLGSAAVFAICRFSPAGDSVWLLTLGFTAIAVGCSGLIGMALRADSPVYRLFKLQPLRTLGRVSYGFYVYHLVWEGGWARLTAWLTPQLHSHVLANAISIPLTFVVTFAVSWVSYHVFERRFLQLKRGYVYDSELTERLHAAHESRGAVE